MKFVVTTLGGIPSWTSSPMWREGLQEALEETLGSVTVTEMMRVRSLIADCLDSSRNDFVAAFTVAKEKGEKFIPFTPFEERLRSSASAEDVELVLGRIFPAMTKYDVFVLK